MIKRIVLFFGFLATNFTYAQNSIKIAEKIIKENDIPEMAFAVITKDSILIQEVVGFHQIKDKQSNAKISDYFHLGSNTKAITGFIAAKLVEEQKINWDTKYFDLFPHLKNTSNNAYSNITLVDLLTHRANIQPYTSGNEYQKLPVFSGNKKNKRQQFSEYVLTQNPINNASVFNYSNAGYSIAAMMLEKVSNKSWEELIITYLRNDLELSVIFGWPNRNYDNQPYGHWIENNNLVAISPNIQYDLSLAEPAGDLSMNIKDYSKFIQLNIEGLAGINNFLTATTYNFIHSSNNDYAIGWGNYTDNDEQISEHTGSDGTFFSYTQIDRKKLIGYIVLVNSGSETAQKGVFKMINYLKNMETKK